MSSTMSYDMKTYSDRCVLGNVVKKVVNKLENVAKNRQVVNLQCIAMYAWGCKAQLSIRRCMQQFLEQHSLLSCTCPQIVVALTPAADHRGMFVCCHYMGCLYVVIICLTGFLNFTSSGDDDHLFRIRLRSSSYYKMHKVIRSS